MRPRSRLLTSIHRSWFYHEQNRWSSTINSSRLSSIPESAYTLLSSRSLIALSGPDSTRFLQGAITNNIIPNFSSGFYSVFLNAHGRILNDVFIYPFLENEGRYQGEQGWLVEVDINEIESLVKRIKRYLLDSKLEIRIVPQTERSVWSVWGDITNETRAVQLLSSSIEKNNSQSVISCIDHRAPGMGHRLLVPGNKKPELEMEQCHEDCYRVRRYLRGVPEGQKELKKEQALPQESNIDLMGGIDYRKGCYVGQELTIRTHHTGVVRKRILPLQIYGVDEKEPVNLTYSKKINFDVENIPLNTSISRWEGIGRPTGKWLAGMGNVGLGICRLADMTDIRVGNDNGGYKVGDEFKIQWESVVGRKAIKVKAFLLEWHKKKI